MNDIGEGNIYIEGDSDIIDEAAEDMNNSFDQMRKSKYKKPKSLDDFDGEEEEDNTKDDFFKSLMNDKILAGEGALYSPQRNSIKDKSRKGSYMMDMDP